MSDTTRKEICNLLERKIFKIKLKEEVPDDPNVLQGRFDFSFKSTSDAETNIKAQYVLGRHRDRNKLLICIPKTFQS